MGVFVTGNQVVWDEAGPDEVIGTADDNGTTVPGLQRQIVITDICDPDRPSSVCTPPGTLATRMRRVAVIITYNVGRVQRTERIDTILTNYDVD